MFSHIMYLHYIDVIFFKKKNTTDVYYELRILKRAVS